MWSSRWCSNHTGSSSCRPQVWFRALVTWHGFIPYPFLFLLCLRLRFKVFLVGHRVRFKALVTWLHSLSLPLPTPLLSVRLRYPDHEGTYTRLWDRSLSDGGEDSGQALGRSCCRCVDAPLHHVGNNKWSLLRILQSHNKKYIAGIEVEQSGKENTSSTPICPARTHSNEPWTALFCKLTTSYRKTF